MKSQGFRAVMLYFIARDDCDSFGAAHHIDPDYASGLSIAREAGVELLAYSVSIGNNEIKLRKQIQTSI